MKRHYNFDKIYFSLPVFALMGNWNFGLNFKTTALTHCTHLQNTQTNPISHFCKKVQSYSHNNPKVISIP